MQQNQTARRLQTDETKFCYIRKKSFGPIPEGLLHDFFHLFMPIYPVKTSSLYI